MTLAKLNLTNLPQAELQQHLEYLWDLQEKDEWPLAEARRIRAEIDRTEAEIRLRRSR